MPGLYGFVSATKWVTDLELTRFDRVQAYWTKLGWSERAPIKTQSRIDVPRDGQKVPKGPVTFGGVAWAQHRGIQSVQVRIDDGPWQFARLGASYSNDAWRLWSFPWEATQPGTHRPRHRQHRRGANPGPGLAGARRRHRLALGLLRSGLGPGAEIDEKAEFTHASAAICSFGRTHNLEACCLAMSRRPPPT